MNKVSVKHVLVGLLAIAALAMVASQLFPSFFRGSAPKRAVKKAITAVAAAGKIPLPKSVSDRLADTPPAEHRVLLTNLTSLIATPAIKANLPRWNELTRDPFQARYVDPETQTQVPVPAAQVLKLSGIWRQTDSRLAVINKLLVREGDEVLGFKILSIDEHQVTVSGIGGKETLPLRVLPGGGAVIPARPATNAPATLTNAPGPVEPAGSVPSTNPPAPAQ